MRVKSEECANSQPPLAFLKTSLLRCYESLSGCVRGSVRLILWLPPTLGFLFPNHVPKAACREQIVYLMMAHERILDYVSRGGKRIRSQELRLLPDSISTASLHNLLQDKIL
jgi:hypothetical protein